MKQSGVSDLLVMRGLLEKACWSAAVITDVSKSVLALLSLAAPNLVTFDLNGFDCLRGPALVAFSLVLGSCVWLSPTCEVFVAVEPRLPITLKFDWWN